MQTREPDSALEALPDADLRSRLAREGWECDPQFVSNEQLFRLFRCARMANDPARIGLLSGALSRRLLSLARAFVVRSHIVPWLIGDLGQASEELSQYFWECLVTRPKDAEHAERLFGQLFKRRALDFQRRLLAKKRKFQVSLDAMDHLPDDNDPERTVKEVCALRRESTPEIALARKQEYLQVNGRLQAILTQNEYSVYVMLNAREMSVKDIAVALGVTPRSINNYKNAALAKIQKEFNQ